MNPSRSGYAARISYWSSQIAEYEKRASLTASKREADMLTRKADSLRKNLSRAVVQKEASEKKNVLRVQRSSDTRTENPAETKTVNISGEDQPRVPAGNPDGGQWTK